LTMDRNRTLPVVPAPTKIAQSQGPALELTGNVSVTINKAAAQNAADYLTTQLAEVSVPATTLEPDAQPQDASGVTIALELTSDTHAPNADGLPGTAAESYQVSVAASGVKISASAPAGLQHGVTTLLHLL